MIYKRSDVNEIMKAIALLKSKRLISDDSSMLRTLDAYTCSLDWEEEWAFGAHHYSYVYAGYTLSICGVPGKFKYEGRLSGTVMCNGQRKTVAQCEYDMLTQLGLML